jgi:hypothetical protein
MKVAANIPTMKLTKSTIDKIAAMASDYYGDEGRSDAKRLILYKAIRDLSVDERGELRALMWLGRGDAEENEWESLLQDSTSQSAVDGADADGSYIGGKKFLAEYLRDGLLKLEAAGFVVRV